MFIPRSAIVAFLLALAASIGWLMSDAFDGDAPLALADAAGQNEAAAPAQPGQLQPATNIYLPEQAPPTIELTIATLPKATSSDRQGNANAAHRSSATAAPPTPALSASQHRTGAAGAGGPYPTARDPMAPGAAQRADGLRLQITPQMAATAIGQDIVIAYDGSIVLVGDNGRLTANTGDAVQGGTVALDAESSTFSSNHTQPAIVIAGPNEVVPNTGTSGSAPMTASSRSAGSSLWGYSDGGALAGGSYAGLPSDVSPLVSAFSLYTQNRTADIAGFEDHSVLTRGMGNVVTYDDSNVFMNRDGKINANTGDTDSAGLNAVAVLRSIVSAGPHCDDGCDDESIIQALAGVFDEGDVAIDGNGNVVWAPDAADESPNDDDSNDDSLPEDNGDDVDSAADESPDGDIPDMEEPAETRPDADNGEDPEGTPLPGSLIIGGDGIDDLSERVDGVGNVSTYDDSNVVIGGTGDVNAQIGDSDTGGTVVMDIIDSQVSGGNSR